jgi:hypothetical protein
MKRLEVIESVHGGLRTIINERVSSNIGRQGRTEVLEVMFFFRMRLTMALKGGQPKSCYTCLEATAQVIIRSGYA